MGNFIFFWNFGFRLKASYFELLYRQYYSCPTSGSRHCSKGRPRNMNSLPPSLVAIFIMNEGRLHLCIMDRCYYRSQLLKYSQVCQSVHKWRIGYIWCQVPSCSLVPCPVWVGRVSLVPRSFRGAVGYLWSHVPSGGYGEGGLYLTPPGITKAHTTHPTRVLSS